MYRKILYEKYLSSVTFKPNECEKSFNENIYLQKEIEDALPTDKNTRVLDLGCGFGSFLNTLRQKGMDEIFGVEIGDEQNDFLKNKGLKVYQEDIISFLKSDEQTYKLITMFDVLEHFNKNEIVEIIPLLKNRLTDDGQLIVRVPNAEAIFKGSIMYGDFTHETFFTKRSLIQVFNIFGFRKIDVYKVSHPAKTIKAKIAKVCYNIYTEVYKLLLRVDNSPSLEYFCPTQNILAIIQK